MTPRQRHWLKSLEEVVLEFHLVVEKLGDDSGGSMSERLLLATKQLSALRASSLRMPRSLGQELSTLLSRLQGGTYDGDPHRGELEIRNFYLSHGSAARHSGCGLKVSSRSCVTT
jgi:hypothetical protein